MIIRKAKKEDVPKLRKIDTFGDQLNKYSDMDKLDINFKENKKEKSYYETFMYGKKKWCYVTEENKTILGFVLFNLKKREPYYKIKLAGYIDLLFVDKKARGKGISKLLMNKVKEILKKEKITHLELSVHTDNPAHQVWKKHGFKDYKVYMWKLLK